MVLNGKATALTTALLRPIAGTANSSDYAGFTSKKVTFKAGQNLKQVAIKIKNDTTIEADEHFALELYNFVGITQAPTQSDVTIIDNDNPIPSATTGLTATTSLSQLGGVELSWTAATAPLADWPLTTYEYRVSTNGGTTWGAWTATGDGHLDVPRPQLRPGGRVHLRGPGPQRQGPRRRECAGDRDRARRHGRTCAHRRLPHEPREPRHDQQHPDQRRRRHRCR